MLLLLSLLVQSSLEERLKSDPARAVEELADRPGLEADLERHAASDDVELRWGAEAALAELDARRKAGKHFVGLRRVTVEAGGRPAIEVLRELLAPDGDVVADVPAAAVKVDVSLRDVPVHRALDEVCRRAGIGLARGSDGLLSPASREVPPEGAVYVGLQSIRTAGVTHRTRADFTGEPERSTEVDLEILFDPRVSVRVRDSRWTFVSASDEEGRAIEIGPGGGKSGWSGRGVPVVQVRAVLRSWPEGSRRLASLRGVAELQIYRRPESVAFDDVFRKEAQVRECGGFKLTFGGLSRSDRKWCAVIGLEPKKHPGLPQAEDVSLEDLQGKGLLQRGGGWGEGHVMGFFEARAGSEPARVRVVAYPDCHLRKVHFELKDIPLR